jgi:hypothetical protein
MRVSHTRYGMKMTVAGATSRSPADVYRKSDTGELPLAAATNQVQSIKSSEKRN